MNHWELIASIIGGIIASLGLGQVLVKYMEIRAQERSGARENIIIDQLQDTIDSDRENNKQAVEALQTRVEGSERRISELERLRRIDGNYIMTLRNHIALHQGPPPPEFPDYDLGGV